MLCAVQIEMRPKANMGFALVELLVVIATESKHLIATNANVVFCSWGAVFYDCGIRPREHPGSPHGSASLVQAWCKLVTSVA